ncbi:MAG: NADP-dependent phosphogluconate dehydrogenase [Bacteroidota bacterium]
MSTATYDFGMVGLGVMGRNFLLNVADHGYSVVGLDTDPEKASALETEAGDHAAMGTTSAEAFIQALKPPRRIMLLVPAGKVVDIVIGDLLPHLEKGDLIIDGGNSHFEDTDRRLPELAEKGIDFLGVGVSGGAEGARRGPSIMPGGSPEAYEKVAPILEAVSAKVGTDPCVAYMGHGSAGHYVKMVHNGIEYAMMQLLAESYDLLQRVGGLSNEQLQETYTRWNEGALQSFLVEITAEIFAQKDDLTDGDLVDAVLDKAKQKGTGKWTSQHALDLGIPVPSIDAAVTMRGLSAFKQERQKLSAHLDLSFPTPAVDQQAFVDQVEKSLLFAFILCYAQGLALLAEASEEKDFALNMEAIARIWRGGCIIRAALLEDIRQAFDQEEGLANLLHSPVFMDRLKAGQAALRQVLIPAIQAGVPTLTFSSALAYFDSYRTGRLPLNLVQAQRDFFGSHTYERVDREGIFHTEWGQ